MSELDASNSHQGQPTLSVILPNYNHAPLLPRALDALLAQTRLPDEIIIVDDASTDDSIAVIERFAARAPSIRLIRSDRNAGAVAALEVGLNAANGRYLYFAAADDWIEKDFFAIAIKHLEDCPEVGLSCGEVQVVDGPTNRPTAVRPLIRPIYHTGIIPPADVERLLMRSDNWISTGAAVLRRDAIVWAGGFNANLGTFADGLLVRKIALRYGFYFVPRVVMTWCVYPDSVSRQTVSQLDKAKDLLAAAQAYFPLDPAFPRGYAALFRRRWIFSVCQTALNTRPVSRQTLQVMGPQSPFDQMVLSFCVNVLGRLGYIPALTWLTLRLRPYSLFAILRTAASRRIERFY